MECTVYKCRFTGITKNHKQFNKLFAQANNIDTRLCKVMLKVLVI